jgi:hypothetical protein
MVVGVILVCTFFYFTFGTYLHIINIIVSIKSKTPELKREVEVTGVKIGGALLPLIINIIYLH